MTSGSGCEAAGWASVGTGAALRCSSLRSAPLRSAPAPAPETTPREFLFILILLFLALLINYDYWKCLRDIGTEGNRSATESCVQLLVARSTRAPGSSPACHPGHG